MSKQKNTNKKAMVCLRKLGEAMLDCGYSVEDSRYFILNSLFCCLAESNGIFFGKPFTMCVTSPDAEQFVIQINKIFDEIPPIFPRVHYSEFNEGVRQALLQLCRYDWSEVSPTLLGTIYTESMADFEQKSTGSFFTQTQNILNTINPLFLDKFKKEFELARSDEQLRALKQKISEVKILEIIIPSLIQNRGIIKKYPVAV